MGIFIAMGRVVVMLVMFVAVLLGDRVQRERTGSE